MSGPIGTDERLDRIEELEAQLAEEIKISNERDNHIEFVLLPQMSDLSAQLDAMTAERDKAIFRAYAMALEAAAIACDKERDEAIEHDCRTESIGAVWSAKAIRAMTPPADLVEQVLKGGE